MRKLLLVFVFLSLAGCVPQSQNPLGRPAKGRPDSLLMGTWVASQGRDYGYLHIGKKGDSGQLWIVLVGFNQGDHLDVKQFQGHTSRLETGAYLSLKECSATGEPRGGYMIIKYQVGAGLLSYALMQDQAVSRAIEKGKLRGQVKTKPHRQILITAGPEELARFVTANDGALFRHWTRLKRLAPPVY